MCDKNSLYNVSDCKRNRKTGSYTSIKSTKKSQLAMGFRIMCNKTGWKRTQNKKSILVFRLLSGHEFTRLWPKKKSMQDLIFQVLISAQRTTMIYDHQSCEFNYIREFGSFPVYRLKRLFGITLCFTYQFLKNRFQIDFNSSLQSVLYGTRTWDGIRSTRFAQPRMICVVQQGRIRARARVCLHRHSVSKADCSSL